MARRTSAEIKKISREQDDLTAEAVRQCRGTILNDTGDGAFIEFRSCSDAVRCGCILQRYVKARNEAQTDDRLKFELHIGIDFGQVVILPNGNLLGNAANLAARVCSKCPSGEVYFTEKVRQELHPREAQVDRVGALPLKGVKGKVSIYRLIKWLGEIETPPNPFIWRSGITKAEDFFGRDNEQSMLRAYLRGRQSCQIVGPRRIGKTSLLRQIERAASEWEENAVVAYLDLQDAQCNTLSGWLGLVSRQFEWSTPAASLVKFSEGVDATLRKGLHPILCLDEFEAMTSRRAEFTDDFFLNLRSCGQRGMSIITASRKSLSDLVKSGGLTSPFSNIVSPLKIGPFANKDAEDFITIFRPGVESFMPEEKRTILEFSKGHPLALQVGCFHVVEAKQSRESLTAAMQKAADDVRASLPAGW